MSDWINKSGNPIFINDKGCPTKSRTSTIAFVLDNFKNNQGPKNKIELFKTISKLVIESTSSLCRNNVSSSFVEGSIEESDNLLVLIHYSLDMPYPFDINTLNNTPNSLIYAFATIQLDNTLYIDTICSNLIGNLSTMTPPPPNGGKTLLNLIATLGREWMFQYIELSALINVINYYRKLGFRHIKNGKNSENPEITRLATLNQAEKLNDSLEAEMRIKIERAFKLAHEIGTNNKVVFNEQLFSKLLKETISSKELEYIDDPTDYIGELPKHVLDSNGNDGLYDFISLLVHEGFAAEECNNITQRKLIKSSKNDDDAFIIACSSSGFTMRKPLFPTQEPGIDNDIIQCNKPNTSVVGGRSKSTKYRRHKNKNKHKTIRKRKGSTCKRKANIRHKKKHTRRHRKLI